MWSTWLYLRYWSTNKIANTPFECKLIFKISHTLIVGILAITIAIRKTFAISNWIGKIAINSKCNWLECNPAFSALILEDCKNMLSVLSSSGVLRHKELSNVPGIFLINSRWECHGFVIQLKSVCFQSKKEINWWKGNGYIIPTVTSWIRVWDRTVVLIKMLICKMQWRYNSTNDIENRIHFEN